MVTAEAAEKMTHFTFDPHRISERPLMEPSVRK
jgi:hypothetical protein